MMITSGFYIETFAIITHNTTIMTRGVSRHEKEGLFLENPGLDGILTVSYERRMTEKIFMVSTISTEKQQLRFTKNNTLAIKGIAIIFCLLSLLF